MNTDETESSEVRWDNFLRSYSRSKSVNFPTGLSWTLYVRKATLTSTTNCDFINTCGIGFCDVIWLRKLQKIATFIMAFLHVRFLAKSNLVLYKPWFHSSEFILFVGRLSRSISNIRRYVLSSTSDMSNRVSPKKNSVRAGKWWVR